MSNILIFAGISFIAFIFRVIVDELVLFLNISDYSRGYAVGFIIAIFTYFMIQRYLP